MRLDDLSPGDRIGNVVVGARVGAGGFGVVYEGRDAILDRRVALKVLLERGIELSEKERARFLREAKALARLQSPHVAAIYHVEAIEGHGWALEMEFVDGGSLAAHLADSQGAAAPAGSPIAVERVIRIGSEIATGLGVAHAQDVVHGDLKPENVLLTSDGTVKLVDFGLAHILGDRRLESTGTVMGTPAYMAPEVIRGEGAGFPSDVWSLGVLLYRMLTGRVPFAADTLPALFFAILENAPPRIGAAVPASLENLVLRCLAKDPASRPDSRTELPSLWARMLQTPAPSRLWSDSDRAVRPALPPSIAAPSAPGREAEIAQICESIVAVDAGRGRTVLVTGDVGMGKSTVVRVAEAEARRRGFRCFHVSLGAAEGLLRPLLDALRRSLAEDAAPGGARIDLDSRTFGSAAPLLRELLSSEREPELETRQKMVWALQQLLFGLSQVRPVALVIEGVHSAEAGEIAILRDLSRRLGDHRVLMFLTARVSDVAITAGGTGALAPFADVEDVVRVPLAPLGREALFGMLESTLGVRLEPDVARDIVDRAGGNPLFALEILRHMEATSAVSRTPKEIGRGPSWGKASLPVRLVDLLAARLRGLPAVQHELLEIASVDGMDFDGEALASVVRRPLLTVLRQLQKIARDTGLVTPQPGGFRFAHALLHDVLHDGVAPAYRREIHAALAKHLESRVDVVDPERIGSHWEAAGNSDRARPYLCRAIDSAVARHEYARAVSLAPRARLSPDRVDVGVAASSPEALLGLARAYASVGGHEADSDATYDTLLRLADTTGDSVLRTRAVVRRAHGRFFARGVRSVDEAELLLAIDVLPPSDDRGRALYLLGVLAKFRGESSVARTRLEEAARTFEAIGGLEGHRASALDQLGSLALRADDAAEAERTYVEAARLAARAGNRFNAAASEVNAVIAAIACGALDGAANRLDIAIRTLALERSPRLHAHATVIRAQLHYARGDLPGAVRDLDDVLSRSEIEAYLPALVAARTERGHLAAVAGDAALAERMLGEAAEAAEKLGDRSAAAMITAFRCQAAVFSGEPERCLDFARSTVEHLRAMNEPRTVAAAGWIVAETLVYGAPVEVLELIRSTVGRPLAGFKSPRIVQLMAWIEAAAAYVEPASKPAAMEQAADELRGPGVGDRRAALRIVGDLFSAEAARRRGTTADAVCFVERAASSAHALGHRPLGRAADALGLRVGACVDGRSPGGRPASG